MLKFTGERIVPQANNCEPLFARKMYQEHIARYLFASQFVSGKDVLDIGCGVGYGSNFLAQHGARQIYAFDLSEDAVNHARTHYAHPAIQFERGNAEEFQVGRVFDVAVCFELIEHVYRQEQVIANIRRHLKDDGLLVISTPRPINNTKRSAFHTHELPFGDFRELLAEHFPHINFFFENNLYVSNIGRLYAVEQDVAIETLEEADLFREDRCDYFVCVASGRPIDKITGSLVINSEQYIKNLERDVAILHRVEDDLRAQINSRAVADDTLLRTKEELLRSREELLSALRNLLGLREQELRASHALTNEYRARLHALAQSRAYRLLQKYYAVREHLLPPHTRRRRAAVLAYKAARKLRHPRDFAHAVWRRGKRVLEAATRRLTTPMEDQSAEIAKLRRTDGKLRKVTFLVGCTLGESKRYRVANVIEGLAQRGIEGVAIHEDIGEGINAHLDSDLFVLFRAAMNVNLARILQRVRAASIPVVFDVDDLIFEPESIGYVDAVKAFDEEQLAEYKRGVHLYRTALLACDAATCTTEFLRGRIEQLGKKARVIPNTINAAQLELAAKLPPRQPDPSGIVRISYLSGSYTHNRDFLEAAPALEEILAENPNVEFHVVGDLDLPPTFRKYASRIRRSPFLPYLDMLRTLARMDINIAPLELNNPYTACKSELKIFEAALVGVPTVVSAVDSYARVIDNGRNGFLASSHADWKQHLTALVRDASLRQRVGEAGRRDFVPCFRVDQIVDGIVATYNELRREKRAVAPVDPSSLDIAWVVPAPFPGSGGHRNIYRAVRNLARYGHRLTVYHTGWHAQEDAKTFVCRHFFELPDVHFASLENGVGPHDVCFATHWSTVEPLMRSRDLIRYPCYFVQDFEPLFYAMGSEYLLAEQTYKLGLTHITSGPWPTALLRKRYNADADYFLFPIQRSVYHPGLRTKKNRNILFFARPEMTRRCYDLGLAMLASVKQADPSLEIILFGSHAIDSSLVPFAHTNLGLLPSLEHLADLYRNADLGIVFSTTNPSLVPYEMMACGTAVCDLALEDAVLNYGSEDNAFLLPVETEAMAQEVLRIMRDDHERQRRASNGCAFTQQFPDEDGCGRRIEELILRRILVGQLNPEVRESKRAALAA